MQLACIIVLGVVCLALAAALYLSTRTWADLIEKLNDSAIAERHTLANRIERPGMAPTLPPTTAVVADPAQPRQARDLGELAKIGVPSFQRQEA